MKEIWKDIIGFEGLYQVSNLGRIKSVERYVLNTRWNIKMHKQEIILKPSKNKKGYNLVAISKNNKLYSYQIHRLVAQAFIPNPDNKQQVNHKNGIKNDNRVDNLEWATPHENMKHAYKNNLISKDKMNYCIQSSISFRKKPILQIKDNVVINEFDSIESAKKMLKVKSSGCLVNALKGRIKTYKGFIWTYKEKGN